MQTRLCRFSAAVLVVGRLVAGVAFATLFVAGVAVEAQTLAYWRFEEGSVGAQPPNQSGVPGPPTPIVDSSGNGYDLGVLNSTNAPTYSALVPSSTVSSTGAANALSLDFAGQPQEIYGRGYTGGGINDVDLSSGWTVEASFRMDAINTGNTYGVLTKQGKPVANKGEPPLLFRIRTDGDPDDNDNTPNETPHFEARGLDGSGDDWSVDSRLSDPLVAGQWYNVAVVYDGVTAELYLDRGNGYQWQVGTQLKTDGWFESTDDWVVGRGFWNGSPGDWMDGQVDEVRISSGPLSPSQFLHSAAADFADVVNYTIDPTRSSMTMSGEVLGFNLLEQSPGSLTTAIDGTISAHLDGNTLTFDDMSILDLAANPAGPFTPELGSTVTFGSPQEQLTYPSTGEENLAFTFGIPGSTDVLAIRDAFFGISGGSAEFDGPVTSIELRTKSSRTDFVSTLFDDAGSDLQGGEGSLNLAEGNLTRTIDGTTETITIPFHFGLGGSFTGSFLSGEIVATRSLGTPGDADGDGQVTGSDLLALQRGFGTQYSAGDFADWQGNYGAGALAHPGSVVPEPASCALAMCLATATLLARNIRLVPRTSTRI